MNTQTSEKNNFTKSFLKEKVKKAGKKPAFLFINLRLNNVKYAVIDFTVFFVILISERALHQKILKR